jgi:hypothetical protein
MDITASVNTFNIHRTSRPPTFCYHSLISLNIIPLGISPSVSLYNSEKFFKWLQDPCDLEPTAHAVEP